MDTQEKERLQTLAKISELQSELSELRSQVSQPSFKPKDAVVGDYVVLVDERPTTWNGKGEMDHYLGKVIKIASIQGNRFLRFNGDEAWTFFVEDIKRKATPEEIAEYNTKPELPYLGGYTGRVIDRVLVYGCKNIKISTFRDLLENDIKEMEFYSDEDSVYVDDVHIEKIRTYIDYYDL